MAAVVRENGSSRDPYPPTTVSLLTNPRSDFKSARTTRIAHLNQTNVLRRRSRQIEGGGPRGARGEKMLGEGRRSIELVRRPRGRSADSTKSLASIRAIGAVF